MNTRLAATLLFASLSLACNREAAPPATATSTATTETVVVTDDAGTAAVDVKVPLTANAVAKCTSVKSTYKPNEPIVLTLGLDAAPEGLQVAARILDHNERLVARVSEPATGKTSVTLTIRDKVPAGKYTLEGLWGGNIVCEQPIEITR